MNIHVSQVPASASQHEVPGAFPVGAPTGATVIHFQPRVRAERLFDVFRSLGGLRPGDTVERIGPQGARLSIDVTGYGDQRIGARLKEGALVIAARSWGGETILRKVDIAAGARILRSWNSGATFNVEVTCEDDGPRPWPMRRFGEAVAAA